MLGLYVCFKGLNSTPAIVMESLRDVQYCLVPRAGARGADLVLQETRHFEVPVCAMGPGSQWMQRIEG
jgi:hypothetical protein